MPQKPKSPWVDMLVRLGGNFWYWSYEKDNRVLLGGKPKIVPIYNDSSLDVTQWWRGAGRSRPFAMCHEGRDPAYKIMRYWARILGDLSFGSVPPTKDGYYWAKVWRPIVGHNRADAYDILIVKVFSTNDGPHFTYTVVVGQQEFTCTIPVDLQTGPLCAIAWDRTPILPPSIPEWTA